MWATAGSSSRWCAGARGRGREGSGLRTVIAFSLLGELGQIDRFVSRLTIHSKERDAEDVRCVPTAVDDSATTWGGLCRLCE